MSKMILNSIKWEAISRWRHLRWVLLYFVLLWTVSKIIPLQLVNRPFVILLGVKLFLNIIISIMGFGASYISGLLMGRFVAYDMAFAGV